MPGGPAAGMRRDVAAFNVFAPVYDRLMWSADVTALQKGISCAERDVERCVEVGGGSGRAAREVGATVLDPAPGMLERAQGRGLETIRASAESLPLSDGSVDAVLVVDAFHHFADPDAALTEAARVLASGGVLVVREFDRSTLRGRWLARGEQLVGFDSRFFTAAELEAAIDRAGLDARPVEYGFGMTVVGVAG